jgi:integrase
MIKKDISRSLVLVYKKAAKDENMKFLEPEEMFKLLDYVKGSKIISEAMIYVALETGLRFGEIAALTKNSINIEANTLSVTQSYDRTSNSVGIPKTKTSIRTIAITKELAEYLDNFPSGDVLLFGDTPITDNAANKQLKRILTKLNASKIVTFHALRHTHASYLLSNDVSIQYVSERLGHANVNITLGVYAHFFDQSRKEEETKTLDLF